MTHAMHKGAGCILLVAAALATSGVRADAYAPDRFKGGSADGYATSSRMRDVSVVASSIRFSGGIADGYDWLSLRGLRMPPRGLLIRIY
jgi:hypothetical protein